MKRMAPMLMAVLLIAAACGSDDSSTAAPPVSSAASTNDTAVVTDSAPAASTESSTAGTSAGSTVSSDESETTTGTDATPPTGEPIVLAMISLESGPGALPDARQAAEAAVAYVNSELGGAAGRPLKLETCITDASPEQSSACANQLLEKNPVAFVGEFDVGTTGSMPIIENSGVSRIGVAAVTPELLFSPASFAFGLDLIPGWSAWTAFMVEQLGASTVNVVSIDFGGTATIGQIISSVAEANGGSLGETSLFPQDATDVSPQMAAAAASNPNAIIVVPSGGTCLSLLQAHASLAADIPMLVPGICGDPRIIEAAGDDANGVYVGFSRLNPFDTSDPEVAIYRRTLDEYSSEDVALSEFASNSFAAVLNVKDLIDELGPDVTPASLTEAVRATKNQKNFMGEPYSCDQPDKLTPATCATSQRVLQIEDGTLVDVGGGWIDASDQASLS